MTILKHMNKRGASAVEFALVLPVLILILFGTIEFGVLLYNQQVLTNASREGARFGIVAETPRRNEASIKAVVSDYANKNLVTFGANNNVLVTITKTGTSFGDDLTVNVNYNFGFLVLPNFITALTGSVNLAAESVMKYE